MSLQASAQGGKTYRVVQWATGNVGLRSLRMAIEHPRMELAGLYVYSADKVGRDAGELVGLEPTGVAATNDIEQILALKPDCVLYMAAATDIDELCRILASGANVVTTRMDFHDPERMDQAARRKIEEACKAGGTSIHSTGSSPGFITEAVPIVLTSISRRLDCLTIDEFADVSSRNSPDMIFNIMGFGQPGMTFDDTRLGHIRQSFSPSLCLLARSFGIEIDGVEASGEVGLAREATRIAAGVVDAGTVAATRMTVAARRGGRPVLRFRANWYVTANIDKQWELRESGWRILVEGDTPLDVSITFPVRPEDYAAFTPGLTAHRPINVLPYVCAAEPGIRTTVDLPQVIARFG